MNQVDERKERKRKEVRIVNKKLRQNSTAVTCTDSLTVPGDLVGACLRFKRY